MSDFESDEIVDLFEFTGEAESVREKEKFANFTKDFSPKQIGSIVKYIEPVNGSVSIEALIDVFKENPCLRALPVEEYDRVVGIIDRRTVEEATNSVLKRFISKPVIDFTVKVSVILQANDYIEKILGKISELNKKYSMVYFPVFERKNFFGLVSLDEFLARMDEIRKQDLEKASLIQRSLFTSEEELSSISENLFEITCWNRMANTLGGDFYKVYNISQFQSLVCCCDVSGKNVAASLLTVAAISFVEVRKKISSLSADPVNILSEFDDYLQNVVPLGNFITGCFVFVDKKRGIFKVFNCGHTTTYLVYGDREVENAKVRYARIEPKLAPLGMGSVKESLEKSRKEKKKPYVTLALKKGIHLNLCSDGFTDMVNDEGFRFEDKNAKDFFIELYKKSSDSVGEEIRNCVDKYIENSMLPDDITVIDIRFD